MKQKWIHMAIDDFHYGLTPKDQGETTLCGKTARRISATFTMDTVTCPRCLLKLQEQNWYCPNHGFIDDDQVTFEETCTICDHSVN